MVPQSFFVGLTVPQLELETAEFISEIPQEVLSAFSEYALSVRHSQCHPFHIGSALRLRCPVLLLSPQLSGRRDLARPSFLRWSVSGSDDRFIKRVLGHS